MPSFAPVTAASRRTALTTFGAHGEAHAPAELGAARSVPPSRARSQTFERALPRLIHDATLLARARQLQQDINPACGTITAARLIAPSCPDRHEQQ